MAGANDPQLRSFIDVPPEHDFPIQNLPYGVVRPRAGGEAFSAVRIGEFVLDLRGAEAAGLVTGDAGARLFGGPTLNRFLAAGRGVWERVRRAVSELLRADNPQLRDDGALRARLLQPISDVEVCLPVEIGDYTDFYSSKQHAFNVGTMFRGAENALMPNYLWIPVGYHGRASSVIPSGTPVRRPSGQTNADDAAAPTFGPCRLLDFELEVGFFVGPGNALGAPLTMANAADHIFGLVLVNDWSARDIQRWEYQPLGPFLAKNFATTISPWIVPLAALEPFRTAPQPQDPTPLPYLQQPGDPHAGWSYDIQLEVALQTAQQTAPHTICRSNFKHLYWTMAQQLVHHTITGCNMRPGDLLASGTISGPTPDSYGSMLELAWRGTKPLKLPSGEERKFLQDGDTVILRGYCAGAGYRIGFGECSGRVLPAG